MRTLFTFKPIINSLFIFCLLSFVIAYPVSASTTKHEPTTVTDVESFIIKVTSELPNKEGLYEEAGYKVVNSLTEITSENNYPTSTKLLVIEDIYNLDGAYKETHTKFESFHNNFSTGKAKMSSQQKISYNPQNDLSNIKLMILSDKVFERIKLTPQDENQIRQKLNGIEKTFSEFEYTEVQGITYSDLNKLKKEVQALKNSDEFNEISAQLSSSGCPTVNGAVEMCGAFDHYYRHNISNGDFTVQALANESRKYHRLHGNVSGNPDAANRLSTFISNINSYEQYIIADMEAETWTEVAGWFGVLTGLLSIVFGYATGPLGWINIVLYYAGALSTFAGLTTTIYATYSRLSLSKEAASYANNARNNIVWMNMQGDATYNYLYVGGF